MGEASLADVNIMGMVLCCRHAFDVMRSSGGAIINLSSLAGLRGLQKFSGTTAYAATKAAVIGLGLTKSCGIADSTSRRVDIFSLIALSILKIPILN